MSRSNQRAELSPIDSGVKVGELKMTNNNTSDREGSILAKIEEEDGDRDHADYKLQGRVIEKLKETLQDRERLFTAYTNEKKRAGVEVSEYTPYMLDFAASTLVTICLHTALYLASGGRLDPFIKPLFYEQLKCLGGDIKQALTLCNVDDHEEQINVFHQAECLIEELYRYVREGMKPYPITAPPEANQEAA